MLVDTPADVAGPKTQSAASTPPFNQRNIMKMLFTFWGIILLGVGGWIANIVKLAGMGFDSFSGMLVLRAIGVFVAPLGSVLGFI